MCVFHQANRLMLKFLRKRIGVNKKKFFLHIENYGNTISSFILLAFNDSYHKNLNMVKFVGVQSGMQLEAVTIFK